jgi:hypothetical protein
VYLDELAPVGLKLGYGSLGTGGALGYEGLEARVQGRGYARALSAHAPSVLVFDLDAAFDALHCWVALNDDARDSKADFLVLADGREAAAALDVRVGEEPRELIAALRGTRRLALSVNTSRFEHCHTVWLDPQLARGRNPWTPKAVTDCLDGHEITPPRSRPQTSSCIVALAPDGQPRVLASALASFRTHATGSALAVIDTRMDKARRALLAKQGAAAVSARPLREGADARAVLCAAASFAEAWHYLCLEPGVAVRAPVEAVFGALDACAPDAVLMARGAGAFAASRGALLRLDRAVRERSPAGPWPAVLEQVLREQDCAVELRPDYFVRLDT